MRKILILVLAVALLAAVVWADNSKRIEELQARQRSIIVEISERQSRVNAEQQAIQGLNNEFVKIAGAIEELQRQDEQAKEAQEKGGNP